MTKARIGGLAWPVVAYLVVLSSGCTAVPNADSSARRREPVPTPGPEVTRSEPALPAPGRSAPGLAIPERYGSELESTDHRALPRLVRRREPGTTSLAGLTDVGSRSDAGRLVPASLGSALDGADRGMPSFTLASLPAESGDSEVDQLRRRVEELERKIDGGQGTTTTDSSGTASEGGDGTEAAGGEDDSTGTDPRSFSTKFMPYYRYTELKNGLYSNSLTMFGLVRLADSLAITYEVPVVKNIEYGSVREFKQLQAGGIPPGQGGGAPPTGIPVDDLDGDGDNVGMGDTIFRVFYKNKHLRFKSPLGIGQLEIMPGFQQVWPTATQDVLGSEAWLGAPILVLVMDMPLNGFVAFMNFYEFDMLKDGTRESVERYIGRYFYMQPLTPPQFMAKGNPDIPDLGFWLSGIYLLPEFQPIYDFENDHFSFWVGPEFGKMIGDDGKNVVYMKPGWGADPDELTGDRDFTFEIGWRYFMD